MYEHKQSIAHRFIITVLKLWGWVSEGTREITEKIKQKHLAGCAVDLAGEICEGASGLS